MLNGTPNFLTNTFRVIFSAIDFVIYWLLETIYNVFFAVSTAEIFSSDLFNIFYSRIQLIIGIFMIFKLSFSVLGYITNPDSAMDKKVGAGSVIMRIAVALVMLTLVIPLNNIPSSQAPDGSLNKQIKYNGVLFGFLYQFQDSVLRENIIGKLVLGSNATGTDEDGNINVGNNLENAGRNMASTFSKTFIRPTLRSGIDEKEIDYNEWNGDRKADIWACYQDAENYENQSFRSIIRDINKTCSNNGDEYYVYDYTMIIGAVVAAVAIIIILGFTIDVSIRAIKLAVLRLLAPIPIINYISPSSEKDGAFGNWIKTLISTYIDLFVRIAIIYFAIWVIDIIAKGKQMFTNIEGGFVTTLLTTTFLMIGALFFAKQAPKFLKDMLGIKGNPMGNVGLSGILGGAAMSIGGGGAAGFALGAMQGATTANEAAAQGKAFGPGASWVQNRDQIAKIRTGDKDARGGIMGSAMDRMLYNTRERSLAQKGLTDANKQLAKDNMYKQQDIVHQAQNARDLAWENLTNMGVTSDPGVAMDYDTYYDSIYSKETPDMAPEAAYAEYQQRHYERKAAWDRFQKADERLQVEQSKYGKIEKNYKDIGGARSALGVDPRLQDEYGHGYRAGGKGKRFNPNAAGNVGTSIDDTGMDRIGPEIGGSH